MNKILIPAFVLGSLLAAKADTLAAWTFENNSAAVNNSPTASTGSGTASSIGMNLYPTPNVGVTTDDVLLGKSSDTGLNGNADTSNTWRVRGQAGSNGAANGWSSAAPIGTQGAVFAASTAGFNNINISFDWYTTASGEANLQLQYTTDGTTWNNIAITLSGSDNGLQLLSNSSDANTVIGSYVSDNSLTGGNKAGKDWFTGLTASITDVNAANNPNFAIEMVNASTGASAVNTAGTALDNSSGNWRFDNVSITGSPLVVPEPSTFALGGLGLAALGFFRRNRKA